MKPIDTRAVRIPVHPDQPLNLRPLIDFRDPNTTLPQPLRPVERQPIRRRVPEPPRWLVFEAPGEC